MEMDKGIFKLFLQLMEFLIVKISMMDYRDLLKPARMCKTCNIRKYIRMISLGIIGCAISFCMIISHAQQDNLLSIIAGQELTLHQPAAPAVISPSSSTAQVARGFGNIMPAI